MSPDAVLLELADTLFESQAIPVLFEYTRIPCLSPAFDSDWESHGHLQQAAELLLDWAKSLPIPGLDAELLQLPGLTPVLVAEVPATAGYSGDRGKAAAVLYGHLDKQPPLGDWREGLEPFIPVREGDRMYGRGIADDGYSIFAALGALAIIHQIGLEHGRCLVLIEATEESGSPHLGPYLDLLADRLGPEGPAVVVCLDSGAPTYDRLWVTTSLRGLLEIELRVDVLEVGVHSGAAGGVVPSSFRILRQLLSRIEDPVTGEVLVADCNVKVPEQRLAEAAEFVAAMHSRPEEPGATSGFPLVSGLRLEGSAVERVIARTWRPSVAVVGIDGVPSIEGGGNVLRAFTAVKIAMRLPPSADPEAAAAEVTGLLLTDPPYGAKVGVVVEGARGFDAPDMSEWLLEAATAASQAYFGSPVGSAGEGGTIPFLAELQGKYPAAQFLVTGVLGPGSNAHGPNEMLHIPTAKAVTACVAHVLSVQP